MRQLPCGPRPEPGKRRPVRRPPGRSRELRAGSWRPGVSSRSPRPGGGLRSVPGRRCRSPERADVPLVRGDGQPAAAGLPDGFPRPGQIAGRSRGKVKDRADGSRYVGTRDRRAPAGQRHGGRAPDAAGGPGDHRHRSRQVARRPLGSSIFHQHVLAVPWPAVSPALPGFPPPVVPLDLPLLPLTCPRQPPYLGQDVVSPGQGG
jgi:hypothetical protein